MNDQPTPQAQSTDPNKSLVDAALNEAGTHIDTPSEQPPADITSSTNVSPTPTPVVGVENTYSPTGIVTPQVEENTTASTPVAQTPVTNTVVPEIPVTDNTVVTPESTMSAPMSEPVEEARANDPIAQAQTMNALNLEEKSFPTESPTPVAQVPAQPEGLVAKFLHIFKK